MPIPCGPASNRTQLFVHVGFYSYLCVTGAGYVVSSGGAARKAGMTREDLLKGNAEIAAGFGRDCLPPCTTRSLIASQSAAGMVPSLIISLRDRPFTDAGGFGRDIKKYCPDVKHVVVVFNPADITGLITLVYSGQHRQ